MLLFFPCKEAIWNASASVGTLAQKFSGCSTFFEKRLFKYLNSLVYENQNSYTSGGRESPLSDKVFFSAFLSW